MKTGLFSVIVATFLTLSLSKLSPDKGDQTVALLSQLVHVSSGVPVVVQDTTFKPPASIVVVNVLWFLSLTLSMSCALLATLMQQWARRYMSYARYRGTPRKQARVRAYMSEGVEKFKISRALEAMHILLHASVFLFFAGLIQFLLPINKVVAFSTLGCVAVFAFIYAILTLLPHWRLNCPYRTPLSWLTYTLSQLSAYSLFSVARAVEGTFRGLLLKMRRRSHPDQRGSSNRRPTMWRKVLNDKVNTHYDRFKYGLRWSVVRSAMEAPPSVDMFALHWTLTTLDEANEFEDFAARMPGFFDSSAPPNATTAMLSLLSVHPTFDPILGSRLHELLETCLHGTSLLDEEPRNKRLRVCLKSLWYCLRAYNLPENLEMPLALYVRAIFASPEVLGRIQADRDPAIRLLGRCFRSLVAKKLASDIAIRTAFGRLGGTYIEEVDCLSNILGATVVQVMNWHGQERAIDLANLISFALGELGEYNILVNSGVKTDVADVFQQTLGMLVEGIDSGQPTIEWNTNNLPVNLVAQFREIYFRFANIPVPEVLKDSLLKDRLRHIWDRLPRTPRLEGATILNPYPSEKTNSPGMSEASDHALDPGADQRFTQ